MSTASINAALPPRRRRSNLLRSPDEVDYYRFNVEQSGWLTVGGQPSGSSNFDGPIRLFLFSDANGNDAVEADELADEFPVETFFVGGTATTYLLGPGTFVVSVSATLDENHQGESHQGEVGAYTLSLARSSVINQLSLAASRVVISDAVPRSQSLYASADANGLQLSSAEFADSETSFGDFLAVSLPSILTRGLSLKVSGSGDLSCREQL